MCLDSSAPGNDRPPLDRSTDILSAQLLHKKLLVQVTSQFGRSCPLSGGAGVVRPGMRAPILRAAAVLSAFYCCSVHEHIPAQDRVLAVARRVFSIDKSFITSIASCSEFAEIGVVGDVHALLWKPRAPAPNIGRSIFFCSRRAFIKRTAAKRTFSPLPDHRLEPT